MNFLSRLFCFLVLGASVAVATPARAAELRYHAVENWAQLPAGTKWGTMTAVDIDSHGAIYVLQRTPAVVMVFDRAGKLLRTWGEGSFPNAHGLRVDRSDNVWITDRGLHQVLKYSPDGKLLLALGKKGVAGDNDSRDALNGPSDVAFGPKGEIFVSDGESTNTRVVKFTADGTLVKFWGTKGTGPGEFDVPHAIASDSRGRLYVADRSNNRVQIFDQEGKVLGEMKNVGTPYGLDFDKDDRLYVVDGNAGKDELWIVDTRTNAIVGHTPGLVGPHMLAVDTDGAVYVAETRGLTLRKLVRE
jgi:peptidylamidoglycolate lyase